MKFVMAFLPSVLCIISAIVMAFNSISGWGWFLFLGALLYPSVTWNRGD